MFRELPEAQRRRYDLTVLGALPDREFEFMTEEMAEFERWRAREVDYAAQLFST